MILGLYTLYSAYICLKYYRIEKKNDGYFPDTEHEEDKTDR